MASAGLHQSLHLAQPWGQDNMGGPHVFKTKGGCSVGVAQPLTAPGFKSQTTMTCYMTFGRRLSFSVPQLSYGVLPTPFLTGWLGGLTIKQHI